jgi:hypothetical protein
MGTGTVKATTTKGRIMPRRDPGPSVKDKELYESLRDDGASKEKAARIANAAAATSRESVGRKGGRATDYDDMTKDALLKRAREIGIEGRSKLDKAGLIRALRNH